MERWRRGVAILKASWSILRGQPELMILPAASAFGVIVLAGGFILLEALWSGAPKPGPELTNPWFYLATFVVYLLCAFIVVFANAALIFCARRSLDGGRATLREGLQAAAGRWPQILGWSALAATVGLILKTLAGVCRGAADDSKQNIIISLIGLIVVSVLDAFWVMLTYFAMPVVALEGLGPIAAIRRSAELIRQRWGEALVGEGALGVFAVLGMLALFAVSALIIGVANAVSVHAAVIVIGFSIIGVVAVIGSVALVTLNAIFVTGAYCYALRGEVPAAFANGLVEAVFKEDAKKQPPAAAAA